MDDLRSDMQMSDMSKNYGNAARDRLESKEEQVFLSSNKKKLQAINQIIYSPDKDPLFFVYLNRLAKAKEFAETDRVDGRDALNKFIHKKAGEVSEAVKAKLKGLQKDMNTSAEGLRGEFMTEFGLNPPISADGSQTDAMDLLNEGIQLLLQQKQTLKEVKTKELSMDLINNFLQQCYVGPDGKMIQINTPTPDVMGRTADMSPANGLPTIREKNLVQKKFPTNRSPTKMDDTFARDDATEQTSIGSPQHSLKALQQSVGNSRQQIGELNRISPLMKGSNLGRPTLQGTGPHEFSQGELSPSAPRFVHAEDPIKFSSQLVKLQPAPDIKLATLTTRDKKRMNEKDRNKFTLLQTHSLNLRSPLVEPEKPNIYSRIPAIFGDKKSDGAKVDFSKGGNMGPEIRKENKFAKTQEPFSYNQLESTRKLIKAGGSSAYLMLKFQIENMQRQELGNYNQKIVSHNKAGLTQATSPMQQKVLSETTRFRHGKSTYPHETPSATPGSQYDMTNDALSQRLDHTINLATISGDLYSKPGNALSYVPNGKPAPDRGFKYTCHHNAAEHSKTIKDQHVMLRINKILEKKATEKQLNEAKLNSFGLKAKPDLKDKIVIPIEASVVVFVEDGSELSTAKCFRYNLAEIVDKFKTTAPNTNALTDAEFRQQNVRFQKQAFLELLEQCSEILGKKFETCFTLEGKQINDMEMMHRYLEKSLLKDYNEGPDSPSRRKQTMKHLLQETNSPIRLRESPMGSKQELHGTSRAVSTKKTMLNERSGSDLSSLSIKGKPRLPHIILLSSDCKFQGIYDNGGQGVAREQRKDNAVEVRSALKGISERMQNKIYLEWVQRVGGSIDKHNIKHSLVDLAANNFAFGNEKHWDSIKNKVQNSPFYKDKLTRHESQALNETKNNKATFRSLQPKPVEKRNTSILQPPFIGGLANANEFMLPQIKQMKNNGSLPPYDRNQEFDHLTPVPQFSLSINDVQNQNSGHMGQQIDQISQILGRLNSGHSQTSSLVHPGTGMAQHTGRNLDPNTYKTLDAILKSTKVDNVKRQDELAQVRLKLPPTTRKQVPFNQRTEINDTSPSSKIDSVEIAKNYVKSLKPRQKKLIGETVDLRSQKRKFNEEQEYQRDPSGGQLSVSVPEHRTVDPDGPALNRVGIDYNKVRDYGAKYRMSGRDIYFLYSQFQSMHEIVKHMVYTVSNKPDTIFSSPKKSADPETPEKPQNGGPQDYDYTAGIPLDIFLANCAIFKGKHPLIINRILKALNIQYTLKETRVSLQEFLHLSSVMTHFTAPKEESLDFWMVVFNPEGQVRISAEEFKQVLEYFVTGSYSDGKGNVISDLFKDGFYKMLQDKHLTEERKEMEDYGHIKVHELKQSFLGLLPIKDCCSTRSCQRFTSGRNKIDVKRVNDLEFFNQLLKPDCDYVLEGSYGKNE